jgi:hypothetical protein
MNFDLGNELLKNEESIKSYMPIQRDERKGGILTFPDIMSGAAGDFAAVYGEYLEPSKHFFYMTFLTCLGNVLAGKVTLQSEISPEPRLYTLILGESADDRKSTAISKTIDFFRSSLTDFPVCYGVGSAEGLQRVFEKNKNTILIFDEFRAFVSKSRIDGSVLLPCVTTLFELNRYESQTRNHSINFSDVRLSLLAASTLDTYERTWDQSFTSIGFNNRLFLVAGSGQRKNSFPEKIPNSDWLYLKKQLGEVLKYAGDGFELSITDSARDLYHQWYMDLPHSIHAKRLDTYAMRLMILLAVNDLKSVIDEDIIKKVTTLCNWEYQIRRQYDPIDADSATAKLEEKIRRILETGSKGERELKRAVNANRTGMWVYMNAIKNLQSSKEIHWNKNVKKWGLI